jgi:uncharacterized protein
VYLEVSCTFDFIDQTQARRILQQHPPDRLLFGSDSPWVDQSQTLAMLRSFALPPDIESALLGGNAARLGLAIKPASGS